MNLTTCALNAYLEEDTKMLSENQTLLSVGSNFSKLKSINKQSSSLAVDVFYAISQAVMPKSSPEAIYIGFGLVVGGLLTIIGICNKNIIYRIPNGIPSPSRLCCVVKKSLKVKFMSIVGFFCKYP